MDEFAAVILTGGTGQRLGGLDKAHLVIDGRTLLESALEAVQDAAEIVVVGPETDLLRSSAVPLPRISFTTEDPSGGGPAAGLLAGRDALSQATRVVVVLAVDMPGVTPDTIRRLIEARAEADADGAFLHDPQGRRQLAGALRVHSLDEVRPPQDDVSGLPMHRLLAPLRLTKVPGGDFESRDVDTPDDLPR